MIIDAHTHIYPDSVAAKALSTIIENGKGIVETSHISGRIIFFGSVHPLDKHWKSTLKEMKNNGVQGLKFHPGYQNFPADSREAFQVYEEASGNNMVLHFHSGFDPSLPHCDYTSIERFANIIKVFNGSKIVLAHAGGMYEWQKVMDLLPAEGATLT